MLEVCYENKDNFCRRIVCSEIDRRYFPEIGQPMLVALDEKDKIKAKWGIDKLWWVRVIEVGHYKRRKKSNETNKRHIQSSVQTTPCA